jgi:hypothetical protein
LEEGKKGKIIIIIVVGIIASIYHWIKKEKE